MAALLVTVSVGVWLQGCGRSQAHTEPLIEFTRLPPAETDSPEKLDSIQGHVLGAKPGDRILVTGTIGDAALGLVLRKGAAWTRPSISAEKS